MTLGPAHIPIHGAPLQRYLKTQQFRVASGYNPSALVPARVKVLSNSIALAGGCAPRTEELADE